MTIYTHTSDRSQHTVNGTKLETMRDGDSVLRTAMRRFPPNGHYNKEKSNKTVTCCKKNTYALIHLDSFIYS